METQITSFEDLEAYKACREFRIYACTVVVKSLNQQKEFELAKQLKDSARSTTANIAEGYGRFHHLDNAKFCSNARGSLYEALEHIITANDEGFTTEENLSTSREYFEKSVKLLNGYINYLYRSANKSKNQSAPQSC